jgi:hypothetical protein
MAGSQLSVFWIEHPTSNLVGGAATEFALCLEVPLLSAAHSFFFFLGSAAQVVTSQASVTKFWLVFQPSPSFAPSFSLFLLVWRPLSKMGAPGQSLRPSQIFSRRFYAFGENPVRALHGGFVSWCGFSHRRFLRRWRRSLPATTAAGQCAASRRRRSFADTGSAGQCAASRRRRSLSATTAASQCAGS